MNTKYFLTLFGWSVAIESVVLLVDPILFAGFATGSFLTALYYAKEKDYMKNAKYRLVKITCPNHTEFWIERRYRFLFFTWWTKTTIAYFRTEEYAIRHLEDLCSECFWEYKHFANKENNIL